MDVQLAGEAAREMDKISHALHRSRELVASVDRARAALGLEGRESYSPLRTLVEQAQTSAERVHRVLQDAAGTLRSQEAELP